MKRSLLINLLLALLVGGLALWMTLQPGRKSADPGQPLSALKRDDIDTIRIEREGLPEFVLQRRGRQWVQTAPFPARTDSSQAGRLLDLVAATSSRRLPATDLERFELDRPFARVTLGDQVFAFGAVNTLTNEQYLLTNDSVHLVTPAIGFGLPTREDALASHMLLAEDEIPVSLRAGAISAETRDGRIALTPEPPEAERPSRDDLRGWLEQWRYASSLATQPAESLPRGELVVVGLKDGKSLEFVVVRRAPELVLARRDENLLYTFPPEQAARLLAPPRGR